MIRGVAIGERGFIRGVAIGERGFIRGMAIGERGLITGRLLYLKKLQCQKINTYIISCKEKVRLSLEDILICEMKLQPRIKPHIDDIKYKKI